MNNRSLIKIGLLFLLTLGIYRFIWIAQTAKELRAKGQEVWPTWWYESAYALLYASIGLLIYGSAQNQTTASTVGIILLYLNFMFFIPLANLWYWKYSKAVEQVTEEDPNFAISMLILIAVPDGLDMIIMQSYYNKLEGAQS